jgi:hypothetical protein
MAWAFTLFRCASPFSPLRKRVTIRIPLAHERTTSDHADEGNRGLVSIHSGGQPRITTTAVSGTPTGRLGVQSGEPWLGVEGAPVNRNLLGSLSAGGRG